MTAVVSSVLDMFDNNYSKVNPHKQVAEGYGHTKDPINEGSTVI